MSAEDFISAKNSIYLPVLEEVCNSKKNLRQLEDWRINELPKIVQKRYDEEPELYLTKPELKQLMNWKLTKGTFRPMLRKLINDNEEQDVIYLTKYAFKIILDVKDTKPNKEGYKKLIREALNTVISLRGVGPATGSLILSLLSKITKLAPPFYSDEAAEYVFVKYGNVENLKLKYSLAEYMKWLDLMWEFNGEHKYDFTDIENGIWALKLNEYYEIKPEDKLKTDGQEANHTNNDIKDEDKAGKTKPKSEDNSPKENTKVKAETKSEESKQNTKDTKKKPSGKKGNTKVEEPSGNGDSTPRTRSRRVKNEGHTEIPKADEDKKVKKRKTVKKE